MADTPPMPPSSSPSAPPSSAADQARIRKERREAKIRAGGSARLNKITGLGGGVQREAPPQPTASTSNPTDDPEEVDISEHYYEPAPRRQQYDASSASPFPQGGMDDTALRQMMLGFDPSSGASPGGPGGTANTYAAFPGMGGMAGTEGLDGEDPMMKMLQQMMGSMGGGDGGAGMPSFPGMPPIPGHSDQAATGGPYAYLWRILHAVFALGLGLYVVFTTPFNGTKIARERSGLGYATSDEMLVSPNSVQHFFWIFATVEVLLQTSRFFFEKGKIQHGGVIGTVMGLLPEPWKGYIALVLRYSRIWTTVSGDAMALVFVLGAAAWLRGN
ncbi:uncharacterized protein L3040_006968 [Drepanopeziza brunnea f. sp. 'multigermtubi']|uniref:GET complex, subunit GET2 n=1 Tax=Marssonina brunnea f. sp. multigermtubi (strain MB_m1) TaxID=1072389 RepID=K1XK52_MARBU|nr:uncharacterized protein MBM_09043 [Drepanopeziza brunnea f. sp. 'multigermtubi' MB_m1]EKD12814.1 hypothetical protein MBM_09043 [Drepanopeziza brunnea f. sp. 'multigermtubi' MB_m1]KAJ5038097.1 hypothetical protein L3040_006968 [Drepanopeziza brunnea f. sp. 'multigermtubi']